LSKNKNEPRWFYLRDENNHPVGCVASKIEKDNTGTELVKVSISIQNPKDNWNKELGRHIALERLGKEHIFYAHYAMTSVPIKEGIMNAIAGDKKLPSRFREAAILWLKDAPRRALLRQEQHS
jgi:hypothetical protein